MGDCPPGCGLNCKRQCLNKAENVEYIFFYFSVQIHTVTWGNPPQGSENLAGSVLSVSNWNCKPSWFSAKCEWIKLQFQLVLLIGETEHQFKSSSLITRPRLVFYISHHHVFHSRTCTAYDVISKSEISRVENADFRSFQSWAILHRLNNGENHSRI